MFKKVEMVNVPKRISLLGMGSTLIELCKWCSWYQKLEIKPLFGTRIKKPYKNCPLCGCPTTIIPDEVVCACGVCRRLLVEKYVITLTSKKVSSVEYDYECYICGNTSNITFLHLCGDGELGECDALAINEKEKPLGFVCIRCNKCIPNVTI
ncbi:MAG: hypothetical protein QW279_09240 [Candidatus Jordarchaeaceae archaeon]